MKFKAKTGILLLLLALPVFIWLFLKFFAQNRYEVPVFFEKGVVVEGCDNKQQPHVIPSFTLKQLSDHQTITEKILNKQITAVYFFSYPCDTSCLEVMEELARVQDVFEKQPNVRLIAIGGESATPQGLKALAEKFNSHPERWRFLAGNEQEIAALKRCGFVLENHQDIGHAIVLIDEERRIRGYYAGTDSAEVDRLILEIRILLYTLNQDHV